MSVNVGTAFLEIVPSARGFAGKLQGEVGGQMAKTGEDAGDKAAKGFKKRFSPSIKSIFAVAGGAALGAGVVSFFKGANEEARESQKIGALTAQVIKSTGQAANVTADQVGQLAGAISAKSGIDDEAIQSASNLLLTFTNLRNEAGKGNDIFNQATQAATDMGAALGKEPKAAAIGLGKALNDPIKGITALSRVGVSFTEGQKEQIKTLVENGNTLGAQKIILGELNKEFGGAAAAQATAGDKAKVAFGNFQEQIGTLLLPILDKFFTLLSAKVIPTVSDFVQGMQDGTGPGGALVDTLQNLWNIIQPLFTFIVENKEAVATFVGILLAVAAAVRIWAAAQAVLNIVLTANPIGIVIVAIAALVAGLVIAYKRSETFRNIVQGAFAVVGAVAARLFGFFKRNWPLLLAILTGPIGIATLLIIKNWDRIKSAATGLVNFVKSIPGKLRALGGMFASAGRAIIDKFLGGLAKAGNFVGDFASGIWDAVRGFINAGIDQINNALEFKISIPASPDVHVNPPNIPHLARGGPVRAGQTYLVGEEGPELFRSSTAGRIVPNDELFPAAAGGGFGGGRMALIVGDQVFDAYVREIAEERVGSQMAMTATKKRMH